MRREQAREYLATAGAPLEALRTALENDPNLWELFDVPLMLWVGMLAYKGASAEEIVVSRDREAQRRYLFSRYIEAMLARRTSRYTSGQTIRWLGWLAAALLRQGQSVFHLEDLHADWLSTPKRQRAAQRWYGLVFGLGSGSAYGGRFVMQHCTVRLVLWRYDHAPIQYVSFLEACKERILLRRSGGGYIFLHRMLMEHFASLSDEEIRKLAASNSS